MCIRVVLVRALWGEHSCCRCSLHRPTPTHQPQSCWDLYSFCTRMFVVVVVSWSLRRCFFEHFLQAGNTDTHNIVPCMTWWWRWRRSWHCWAKSGACILFGGGAIGTGTSRKRVTERRRRVLPGVPRRIEKLQHTWHKKYSNQGQEAVKPMWNWNRSRCWRRVTRRRNMLGRG